MWRLRSLVPGLLSGAAIASVVLLIVVPEILAERETPARIAACHAQHGTAQLDRHGHYRGCLLPPR